MHLQKNDAESHRYSVDVRVFECGFFFFSWGFSSLVLS